MNDEMVLKKLDAVFNALRVDVVPHGTETLSEVLDRDVGFLLVKIVRRVNTLVGDYREASTGFDAAIITSEAIPELRDMLGELQ